MPATPRDAASLIVVKPDATKPGVLMGRRPDSSRFMPGMWVFPGGAVSTDEARVKCISSPQEEKLSVMAVAGRISRARALALAAIRETFEETGIIVGSEGDPGDAAVRRELAWAAFRERGLTPDLTRLTYAGRALTPAFMPIRFHARFFTVNAAQCTGEVRENGELLDLSWIEVGEALRLPLADITEFMLRAVQQNATECRIKKTALFTYRHNRRYIRYD